MDEHSLERLEFQRVIAAIASLAESKGGAERLACMRPFSDAAARSHENRLLAEAIRRQREPGGWCGVGRGGLSWRLEEDARGEAGGAALDGPGLVEVLGWLGAAEETRRAWAADDVCDRHALLAAEVAGLPDLRALRERLNASLEPDGSVGDAASPALRRVRAELGHGERDVQQRLDRWARGFGEGTYVTRHGDRFVAMVPAAGFPRRRGIVHDVSASGQSLFVEPIEACEANNRLIELRAAAAAEEHRILRALATQVQAAGAELLALERILVHLDSLRARARWAADVGAIAVDPAGERLKLHAARHPMLAMGERRERVVPLDLELGPGDRLLLLSGPNMGGKTVLVKTVGLAVALSHAGFPVVAREGSAIPEVDTVLVDLGDEQSLDQGLSTFAAHLRSLAVMAQHAGPRTLLLCDELGAGTDPEEGAALGRALIERFAARNAWAIVTTHLGSLKRVAGEIEGVVNGSLEFDEETMMPLYRFVAGVPGASRALAMAERLGLDAAVLARARAITPEESRALERLLQDLQVSRRRLDEELEALARAKAEAERAAAENHEATENARRTLEELRRRLTSESQVLLSHARELWQTVQREARRSEKTRAGATRMWEQVRTVEKEVEAVEASAEAARAGLGGETEGSEARLLHLETLVPGARVRVVDLDVEAEVVSAPDAEGKVLLRRGSWTINTHASRLAPPRTSPHEGRLAEARPRTAAPKAGEREASATPAPSAHAGNSGAEPGAATPSSMGGSAAIWQVPDEAPPLEVDLRGMEVDEALRVLDSGLDRGVLAGLSELRIIHGVGRGILRGAVERHLREHPQVASHRTGQVGEGGRGVTVARLK